MSNHKPIVKHGFVSSYVENDAPQAISPELLVFDADNTTLAGATVSIMRNYVVGEDILAFTNQNGITGSFDSVTGILTLSGTASLADYQTALRSVTYFNTSEDPSTRLRSIGFQVDDGEAASNLSSVGVAKVKVASVNDAPELVVDPTLTYVNWQTPEAVDATLTLTDVDSDPIGADIQITGNYTPGQDVLAFTPGDIAIHGSFDPLTGILSLRGRATVAEYETVLRTVTYNNVSGSPSIATRTISIQVLDGDRSGLNDVSNVALVDVVYAAPPVVVVSSSPLAYTENGPATTIDSTVTVSDIDDPNLVGGTVSITSGFDAGDTLLFTNTANISGSYNAGTGVLTLTGTASQAEYQAALRSIQFQATSDDPATSKTITWIVNDGTDDSTPQTTTINVTPVNDAPNLTISATVSYTENDAATVIASAATIADPDSPNFNGGSLTVGFTANGTSADQLAVRNEGTGAGQIGVSGSTITYEGVAIGTYTGGANGSDLVVTFTSTAATQAAVQALTRNITFANTSDDPSTLARTVGFTVVDGDGGTDSDTASATVNVAAVNDAPVVTPTGSAAAYTEGGSAAVVDATIALSDADDANLESATASITANFQAGDSLVFVDTPQITGSYNSGTGVLTLTGTATLAQYQTALRTVTFQTTNDDPTATKTVTWVVNDGTDSSSAQTTTVNVTPVNDAPNLTISATLSYTENDTATAIAPAGTVTDPDSPDFNGGSLTASFTANGTSADQLNVLNQGTGAGQIGVSGSNVTYGGVTIGTYTGGANGADLVITFTSASATPAAVQALTRAIAFSNTSDDPSTLARTVGFTLVDGDGGTDTDTASATVNVAAVNDAPVVTTGSAAAYTEGGSAAVVDAALTVSDVDDTNLESATASITANFQAGDSLVFVDTPQITGSYNSGTGVLTLTGTATLAQYQAALRTVTFQTANDDPTATKTVTWVVNDGTDSSSAQTTTVNVTPVNDAPDIAISATLSYTENDAASVIAAAATVTDPDSADFNGGSLTVSFTANGTSADQLAVKNVGTGAGQIGVSGSNVTYAGTTIGTYTGGINGSDLVITFTSAAATQAAVQALVRNVTFANTSDDPSTLARTVGFTVVDGDGGTDTDTASATVNVTAVNDAPVVVTGSAASYTEGGSAAVVDAALTLGDPDDTNLESATASITANFQAGDSLVFVDTPQITGSYNSGTGVLTLTGTATIAQYQAALRTITFQSTNDAPTATKTVTWVVNDGTDSSSAQTTTVNVTAVNDAPDIAISATLSYTENDAASVIAAAATVTDPDSADFNGGSLTVSFTANGTSADQLAVKNVGTGAGQIGVSGSNVTYAGTTIGTYTGGTNGSDLVITFTSAAATQAAVQALVRDITFSNTSDNPSTLARTVSFAVVDGDGGTDADTATATVNVTAVNDAPTVTTSGGSAAFTEGGSEVAIDTTIALSDPDNTAFASATVQITGNYQNGFDVLAFANTAGMGNIAAGAFNAATGTLTLTSAGSTATTAEWQAALAAVTFDSTSGSPGTSRTISFQLNDGQGVNNLSPVATKSIAITEVNSAPTVTTTGGSAAFTENGAAVAVDSGITLADSDTTTLVGATAHIGTGFQTGEDVLSFTPVGSITGSYNSTTGTLTLSGTGTLAEYETALASVKYNNTSDTPDTTTRTIEFQVDDGQSVDNLSTVQSRTVTVAAANDAPSVSLAATLAYTENDAATVIAPAATVTDPDSADFNGGSLTVSFTANGTAADQLAVRNEGTGAGQIGVSGANITYAGTTIGTYAGGANGTDLVVTFSSAAATPAAVQALARNITFSNTSESPSTSARTVSFSVVDGDGGSDTGSATATVNVTSVNDAPALGGAAGSALAYTENDAAAILEGGLTLTDIDSTTLTGATVTVSSNYANGQDVLAFGAVGAITGSFNAATGVLTLSGTDSLANYQTALRSVTYVNTSENPSAATRTVSFQANDGGATDNLSNVVTRDIGVTPVNDAPAIVAGGSLSYTENASATVVKSTLTLTDAEGDNITGATATISANYASGEDILSFTPAGSITGSFNSGTGVLTLSGTGTAAEYQAVLRTVTYANSSDDPSTAARTVSFQATDSHGDTGTAATTTVNVTAVNDAPVNTVPADASVGTAFSNTSLAISGVSIADVDAESGTLTVALSAVSGGLTVSLAGGASVSAGTNGTSAVTLSGTVAQLNAALSTLSYKSNDGFTGSDTISVVTNDAANTGTGGAKTDTDTFHVGVVPQVFIIDNTNGTVDDANSGTAANPFNSIASFNTLASDGTGDYIYVKNGSGTYSESDGFNLLTSQSLYGQGQTLQFTNPVTGAVVTVGTGASGTTPTVSITGASNHGVDLATGNTITGLNIATTAGSQVGISDGGGTVGALTISDVDVTGAGMAVDIDQGGALNVTIDTLSSSASSGQGVQLAATGTALTGTFTATTGTIAGSTGTAFLVGDGSGTASTGGAATISYGGSISAAGAVRTLDIEDRVAGAGTVTISGSVNHTSGGASGVFIDDIAAGAITLSGNNTLNTGTAAAISATDVTGGSLTFSGTQDIDTTSGTGISLGTNSVATSFTGSAITVNTTSGTGVGIASNSGTVSFNDTGAGLDVVTTTGGTGISASSSGTLTIQGTGNTISSTGGTGLSVSSTTIGASGLNFVSISSSSATNGIVLSSTGSTGGLTVTGSGSANTGGTISGTTGDGVSVTSGVINLAYMLIQNAAGHGLALSNLLGTDSFNNGTITGFDSGGANSQNGINFVNTGSNAGSLTVSGSTISAGSSGNDGIYMEAQGSGAMTLTVSGSSTFTGLYGDGVQVNGITGATSVVRVTIQNSSFVNAVASTGNGGISMNPFGDITFYADVNNNTFSSIMNPVTTLGAIGVTNGGTADADITIRNNTISDLAGSRGITITADGGTTDLLIDNNNIDDLGSTSKAAINVNFINNSTLSTVGTGNVTVSNNDIGQNGSVAGDLWTSGDGTANAILLQALNGASMTAAVTNNVVDANTTSVIEVVRVRAASTSGNPGGTINATVTGNNLQDTETTTHVEFDASGGSSLAGTVNLSISGNNVNSGGVIQLSDGSTGVLNVTQASAAAVSSANNSATVNTSGSPTYGAAAPPTPSTPSLPLLVQGEGSGDASSLTQESFLAVVSAAVQRWAASGLSAAQLDTLSHLQFGVVSMDADNIGAAGTTVVLVDDDAGGRGWFVDTTPLDDSEFTALTATHLWGSTPASANGVDLLTALMHEIGHTLGLGDSYGAIDADSLMYGMLSVGERRLPVTLVGTTDGASVSPDLLGAGA